MSNLEIASQASEYTAMPIVAIGGGSGMAHILRGLQQEYPDTDVAAVVTITDDGGSSRDISRALDIIAVGDIRQSVGVLCDDKHLESALINHRYEAGASSENVRSMGGLLLTYLFRRAEQGTLQGFNEQLAIELADAATRVSGDLPEVKGHAYGNLLIAGAIREAGQANQGVDLVTGLLGIRGSVHPVSQRRARLVLLKNGVPQAVGQSDIDDYSYDPVDTSLGYSYDMTASVSTVQLDEVEPNKAAIQSIENAQVIVAGPGSIDTSVLAAVNTPGISEAVMGSGGAVFIVPNMIVHPNALSHHAWRLDRQARMVMAALGRSDAIVVNTDTRRLQREGYEPLRLSQSEIDAYNAEGVRVIGRELADIRDTTHAGDSLADKRSPAVHKGAVVASAIKEFTAEYGL